MEPEVKDGCGYFITPNEREIKAAEHNLYNAHQIESAVCDYFGITRNCLHDNGDYAEEFYKKYGCDLLYDILDKKSPLYMGGQITGAFKRYINTCEEQEAWYLAADEVLSKYFFK